jgi:SMI1 / KNR4 family (SUKH-1)
MLADTLRQLGGFELRDEDGQFEILELLPPATDDEVRALEDKLPCALPAEIRAALNVSAGLANGPLESFNLTGLAGFAFEDVFPFAHSIAHDGYGNYWVVDLYPDAATWNPVFYACHDPPVIVYQAATVEEFLRDAIQLSQPGRRSPVDVVHEDTSTRIWKENPDLIAQPEALNSPDPEVAAFAATLSPDFQIIDLRRATTGQGFSWGRYGPATICKRHGVARLWGIASPGTISRMSKWLFGRDYFKK